MKRDKKLLVLGVLIMGILGLGLTPTAKTLSFTYSDGVIAYLTVSGPDLAKPGNTESYTVSGSFTVVANDFVHITLWLETSSQFSKVVLEEDPLPPGTYSAGTTFTKTYQVFIPNDAVNNRYIYANMTTSIRQFSKIGISLVQNLTYTELQFQVTSLQSQVSSLRTQNDNLQSQVNSLQTEKSELQSQIDSLNSNVTDLESQINSLQSQLNDLRVQDMNATNLSLFSMGIAAVFVATTIFFAVRKPKVKTT